MIEFLSPVSKAVVAHREVLPLGTLGKQINVYRAGHELPELKGVSFAIVGVKENRNDINYIGEDVTFDPIRNALYGLYPGNWTKNIVDLGDVEKGASVEDSFFAVQSIVHSLLKQGVIPLILGGSQDLVFAQYRAYDQVERMINIVNIDNRFDLGDAELPISNKSYVGKIIVDTPYNLFNYSALGYQSYFNPPQEIGLMDKLFFDAYRLGEVIADIKVVEPIFRNAHLVTLDVNAIKSTALSYKDSQSPNGFDSREICAIARYAGISNTVQSFSIFEASKTVCKSGAMLIAQVLWYFIEGVNFRQKDDNFNDEKCFKTYKVPVQDEILTFKKSTKTGRWWIELPIFSNVNNKLKNHTLLPCTYDEYVNATEQKIPERWYKARRKNEV